MQDAEAVYLYRRAAGLADIWLGRPGNYWVVQTIWIASAIAGLNTYGITDCPWSPGGIRVKRIDQRRPDIAHTVLDEILLSTSQDAQAIDLAVAEAGRPDPANYHAGNVHSGDERVWHRFLFDGVPADLPAVGQWRRCQKFELHELSTVYSKVSSIDPSLGSSPLKFWLDKTKWVKLLDHVRTHRWEAGRAHFNSDITIKKVTRIENGYIMMLGLAAPIVLTAPGSVTQSVGTVEKAALIGGYSPDPLVNPTRDLLVSPIPGVVYVPALGAVYWNPTNSLSINISTPGPALGSFIQDTPGAHAKFYRYEWLSNAAGDAVAIGDRRTVSFTIDVRMPLPG